MPNVIKLNLGAGASPLAGYDNTFDLAHGKKAYPLDVPDGSANEIRASHLFEHFSHRKAGTVLADWVRALKPGGLMRLAVPDFEKICHGYTQGLPGDYQGWVCGGHTDGADVHLAQYDWHTLALAMREAGLVGIHDWQGAGDCSALPVSLNLAGWKRPPAWPKVTAVMSVPRLGFMDNFFCAFEALHGLRIGLRKFSGAFWGQCLERAIELALAEDKPDYVLTLDYDSIFDRTTVEDLLAYAVAHPEADAICPLEMSRGTGSPLMKPRGVDVGERRAIAREDFAGELYPLETAHFGCTLLRAEKLAKLEKPWFWAVPAPAGAWGEGRTDDDIYFWRQWQAAGHSLYLAPRVSIGHLELVAIWPDRNMEPLYQAPGAFWKEGYPRETWR